MSQQIWTKQAAAFILSQTETYTVHLLLTGPLTATVGATDVNSFLMISWCILVQIHY